MLDLGRPEDDGNREREAQPKLVAKHRHGVTGVTVMASVAIRHPVAGFCLGPVFVLLVRSVIHRLRTHTSARTSTGRSATFFLACDNPPPWQNQRASAKIRV